MRFASPVGLSSVATEAMKLSALLADLECGAFTDCDVAELALDSREASQGCAFVAVQGGAEHGLRFAPQACELGAKIVLHDGLAPTPTGLDDSTQCVEVAELGAHLGLLAQRLYSISDRAPYCIAVTGTNGKTSCVQNYAALLSKLGLKSGSIGTLGWGCAGSLNETGLTTPDVFTVHRAMKTMAAQGAVALAIEASSHALQQERLAAVPIRTAVFTNLSRDHLDFHGSIESYASAKARLFERRGLENAVLNADDPYFSQLQERVRCSGECLSYSTTDSAADIFADNITLHSDGVSAVVRTPWGQGEVHLAQIGLFNLQNLLAVIACAWLTRQHFSSAAAQQRELGGDTLAEVLGAVAGLATVPGRMQLLASHSGPHLIVDYAHTPDGLLKALQAVGQHCEAKLWVVFGCGGDRDKGKRAEMAAVARQHADHVIITSDNPRTESPQAIIRDIEAGLSGGRTDALMSSVQTIEDRQQAIETAVSTAQESDWVLLAGKGHENYQHLANGKVPFDDALVARAALAQRASRASAAGL